MTSADTTNAEHIFARLLQLERLARQAENSETLAWSMVNDSQSLLGFRHAALLIDGRVRALTGVSVPDPHAPFVAFTERAARQVAAQGQADNVTVVIAAWLDEQTRQAWQSLSAAHALWVPLKNRRGERVGGLWFARDTQWQEHELLLAGPLAECWAHAWQALAPRRSWRARRLKTKVLALVVVVLVALLIPVRQSVLAPAEVVPLGGQVVTAPLDGVIAQINVRPNQVVKKGFLLAQFDSTVQKAQADVAARALGVAEAELRSGAQRAFQDAESKARLDLLAAQVEQKRAELAWAQDLLQRSDVRAGRDGIAVFADADQLVGKPVSTGERLMAIADPQQAELKIELDVGDAIDFPADADVTLFLDSDPLVRHDARLTRVAYESALTAQGSLAWRLDARFIDKAPRIGLRGTAKVYGERVPLALYLLRRPLAALRKAVGL
nr:HlyD family efflux transporter periplasmic adaptor subunit [uncultured Enterobacter sp.]